MSAANQAVFLSYASQDVGAALRICGALRAAGVEVWFDQDALVGGDAWDAKIRGQVKTCALFVPVISANTNVRTEGYFRLEWHLAEQRMLLIAHDQPFLVPVVIDDTTDAAARVPDRFRERQWTRLPGGETSSAFCARVRQMLGLDLGVARAFQPVGSDDTGWKARATAGVGRRVPAAAWMGVLAVVALGIAATFFATRKSESASAATSPNAGAATRPPTTEKSAAAAPVSEARQLVAKARALYEPWDLASNEDFDLAEQLLKKATDLDPADGDAWGASAILSCAFSFSRQGQEQHQAAARSQAARAIKLAPDSDLARFAYAFSLRFDSKTRDECLRLLREEVARQPGNRMVVRLLGTTLAAFDQLEQALVYFDKAAAIPGRDPVMLYNRAQTLVRLKRYPETEAALDEALALAPAYSNARAMKILLLIDYHGDMAQARQHLERVPPDFYNRDAGVVAAALTWLYSREALKCIETLRPARDDLRFYPIAAPKAYLAGLAQSILGNADAARTVWRTAMRVVDKLLEAQPNSVTLLENRALLLAALGQKDEAEPLLRELIQRAASSFTVARVQALLGQSEEAITTLESTRSRTDLRYRPEWDSLRGNPRFEALFNTRESKK